MYLKRLEIQGFKSFANNTVLEFRPGITSIVGPNGSGKSNIADAIRWVLGEQSKLLLRGKAAADVIFAGSDKRTKGAHAQVSVVFDNQDKKLPVDAAEVVVTRRVSRDGTSEYLINNEQVRLMDVTEVLRKAGFAKSAYTVIGQGIIEQFLLQGPAEIKSVIEEAAGLSPFYDKHQRAARRLKATRENLAKASSLISEIEPRLKTLRRQAKKLEQRSLIEKQWRTLLSGRLAFVFSNLEKEKTGLTEQLQQLSVKISELEKLAEDFFNSIEQDDDASKNRSQIIADLQKKLAQAREAAEKLRLELARYPSQKAAALAPDLNALAAREAELSRRCQELARQHEDFQKNLAELEQDVREITEVLNQSKPDLLPRFNHLSEKFLNNQKDFLAKIAASLHEAERALEVNRASQKGAAQNEPGNEAGIEEKLKAELAKHEQQTGELQEKLTQEINQISVYTDERREADKKVRQTEQELNGLRQQQSELKVSLARVEARLEEEGRKGQAELGPGFREIIAGASPEASEKIDEQVAYLKKQLDAIGSLDDLTMQEYEETEERYTYLTSQVHDLESAARDLEEILAELNSAIKERFKEAFSVVSSKFSEYFRILFNGGKADLKRIKNQELRIKNDDKEEGAEPEEEIPEDVLDVVGIEVSATPPGKKLSAVSSLSGGERTLTTIALLVAMLDAYPSPFVVLDEVDAALDESNSIRFAKILGELESRTQFVTITHNRETMRRAHTLYGVTMNDSGVSQILSIQFDQSLEYAKE